jgi:PEP-CTERM motif
MYMWERNMNILTKSLAISGLVFGFATCASAQVTWTLSDVTFDNGNVATGSFTTNAATDHVLSFSIDITGPDTAAAFTVAAMVDTQLAGHIGLLGGPENSQDAFLTLLSDMTNAGGTIPIVSGVDCPPAAHCGTLVTTGHSPEIIGVTPEPATAGLMLLGLGIMVRKYVVRRRQQSTETRPS